MKYRERVYAYELYHCLRSIWPEWQYSLGGEIDKRNHPLIRGQNLDNVKSDLLVHVPGDMDDNLAVVEIKAAGPQPPTSERLAVTTDLKKFFGFHARARYEAGFLLVFGADIDRIQGHVVWSVARGVQLEGLELWHHVEPAAAARHVDWCAV